MADIFCNGGLIEPQFVRELDELILRPQVPELLQGGIAGGDAGVGGAGGIEKLPGGGGVGVGEDVRVGVAVPHAGVVGDGGAAGEGGIGFEVGRR